MDKNYVVTKSNKLITSNYDLSLQEQKIILTLASMVQPQDTEFKEYEFKIKDFIELLGVEDKKKYIEIPKMTKELMKKVFEIREGKDIIQLAWLSSARYKTGEGTIFLKFDSNLKPYMLELKELYTSYKLENVLSLKSKYSIRLYEVLKSNLFKKCIDIEMEELKKMVGAKEKSYNTYANFKNKVLFQGQKELKKLTDISFDFEEIKTGRKVTALKFFIKENANNKVKKETPIISESTYSKNEEIEKDNNTKKVLKIMNMHEIEPIEAKKIFDSAKGDFQNIEKCYTYCCKKKVANIVGYMIKLVKPGEFITPKENSSNSTFNDFEHRDYKKEYGGFDELEEKLLYGENAEDTEEKSKLTIDEIKKKIGVK